LSRGSALIGSEGHGVIAETPISPDVFKQGMRLLAGGVCILAASRDGEWHGMTMTAVCSLTMDPPTLIACVNRSAGAYEAMSTTGRVSVNVLSRDHTGLAERFASSEVKGPARFDSTQWSPMASGVPALIEALAVLDCEVIQDTVVGHHSVLFCQIRSARLQPEGQPLVHFNREFCTISPVG